MSGSRSRLQGSPRAPRKFRLKVLQVPCSLVKSSRRTLLRIHNKAKYRQLVKWNRKICDAFAP